MPMDVPFCCRAACRASTDWKMWPGCITHSARRLQSPFSVGMVSGRVSDLAYLLQTVFLLFFQRYVVLGIPIEKEPGALLTTIFLNLLRSQLRQKPLQRLPEGELHDPAGGRAAED